MYGPAASRDVISLLIKAFLILALLCTYRNVSGPKASGHYTFAHTDTSAVIPKEGGTVMAEDRAAGVSRGFGVKVFTKRVTRTSPRLAGAILKEIRKDGVNL